LVARLLFVAPPITSHEPENPWQPFLKVPEGMKETSVLDGDAATSFHHHASYSKSPHMLSEQPFFSIGKAESSSH